MSKAQRLQTVADACTEVARHLNDLNNEYPHVFRVLKDQATGVEHFHFETDLIVDGRKVLVKVGTM